MNWIGFSDYDIWKTTEPLYEPRQEDYCLNAGCRKEAEYHLKNGKWLLGCEGYCEDCFELIEEERRLEGMQEIEWGDIEQTEGFLNAKFFKQENC